MYILHTGTGYVERVDILGKIHTTRFKTESKKFKTWEDADNYRSKNNIESVVKIKKAFQCDDVFTISRVSNDFDNRKYIIKLINSKYLKIGHLTDVQIIYKDVEFEDAQLFTKEYAESYLTSLRELCKLENWELYEPVGIEEVN